MESLHLVSQPMILGPGLTTMFNHYHHQQPQVLATVAMTDFHFNGSPNICGYEYHHAYQVPYAYWVDNTNPNFYILQCIDGSLVSMTAAGLDDFLKSSYRNFERHSDSFDPTSFKNRAPTSKSCKQKRRVAGAKKKAWRKKLKYELGRQPKISSYRIVKQVHLQGRNGILEPELLAGNEIVRTDKLFDKSPQRDASELAYPFESKELLRTPFNGQDYLVCSEIVKCITEEHLADGSKEPVDGGENKQKDIYQNVDQSEVLDSSLTFSNSNEDHLNVLVSICEWERTYELICSDYEAHLVQKVGDGEVLVYGGEEIPENEVYQVFEKSLKGDEIIIQNCKIAAMGFREDWLRSDTFFSFVSKGTYEEWSYKSHMACDRDWDSVKIGYVNNHDCKMASSVVGDPNFSWRVIFKDLTQPESEALSVDLFVPQQRVFALDIVRILAQCCASVALQPFIEKFLKFTNIEELVGTCLIIHGSNLSNSARQPGSEVLFIHELWLLSTCSLKDDFKSLLDNSMLVMKLNLDGSDHVSEFPGARAHVGLAGPTFAEHVRDVEGQDMLLFIDNIFRCTQAKLEVSTLLGRIPSIVGDQLTLATTLGGPQELITTTKKVSIISVQAIYVPTDDLSDTAPATTFSHLDVATVLSRQTSELGINFNAGAKFRSIERIMETTLGYDPGGYTGARTIHEVGGEVCGNCEFSFESFSTSVFLNVGVYTLGELHLVEFFARLRRSLKKSVIKTFLAKDEIGVASYLAYGSVEEINKKVQLVFDPSGSSFAMSNLNNGVVVVREYGFVEPSLWRTNGDVLWSGYLANVHQIVQVLSNDPSVSFLNSLMMENDHKKFYVQRASVILPAMGHGLTRAIYYTFQGRGIGASKKSVLVFTQQLEELKIVEAMSTSIANYSTIGLGWDEIIKEMSIHIFDPGGGAFDGLKKKKHLQCS